MAYQAVQTIDVPHGAELRPAYTSFDADHGLQLERPPRKNGQSSVRRNKPWRPFSLRPTVLALFAALLLCLLAALVTLWFYMKGHDGLNLLTNNHYTWTYGPTAIFIIVISYWRLVDYHCKALIPWMELENGPITADRSILLDHISPFLFVTLVSAAKTRHFVVVMTIVGFLLLKIVTIASTGLFFPSEITVGPFDVDMVQTSQFDTISNFSDFADPGASPFYNAYAIMERGSPLPEGLTNTLLYETYRPSVKLLNTNATYTVQSRAFAPLVSCEIMAIEPLIDLDAFGSTVIQYEELQVQNTSKWTCPSRTDSSTSGLTLQVIDAATRLTPPRQVLPSFGQLGCEDSDQTDRTAGSPFLVSLSDVRYYQTYNISTTNITIGDIEEPQSWDFDIPNITGMLCSVSYEMKDVSVFYNMSLSGNKVQDVTVLDPSSPARLQNVSDAYLAWKLRFARPDSSGGARDMFGLVVQFDYVEQPPHTVLTMIANHAKGDYISLLEQPQTFLESTEYVLNNMLMHIAKETIMIPDTNSTFRPVQSAAQESHTEGRLVIQLASFIVMVVGISILVLMTITVLIFTPKTLLPHNPEAIPTNAEILEDSRDIQDVFKQLATSAETPASVVLKEAKYQLHVTNSRCVLTYHIANSSLQLDHEDAGGSLTTYRPLMLSKICLALTLLSAPVVIAVLEILQHLSDSGFPGIATIQDSDSLKTSLYSRFLPAIVALLIATMLNCLDFNTAMLAPYSKMSTSPGTYEDLRSPMLAHMPPIALLKAFQSRYWAALLTGIGALVGSVLTIIVSSLYTVDRVPMAYNLTLSHTDSWNMSYIQGASTDNAAAAVSSLIESANLSYPQFTYDQLAFPSLDVVNSNHSAENLAGLVSVKVPALRAELVCEEIPWSFSNASVMWNAYKTSGWTALKFNVTVPLPGKCQYASCHGNESSIYISLLDAPLIPNGNVTYYGQAVDIHTGPWDSESDDCDIFFTASGSVGEGYTQPVNQPGCPSMAIVYGYFDGNDQSKSAWTTLLCEQRVQQIDTSVTLSSPDMNIQAYAPPMPDEPSAKYLTSDDSITEPTFGWWHAGLDWSYVIFNKSAVDPLLVENDAAFSNTDNSFSNFFRGTFFGRTPLALSTLQKNDTDTRNLVFDHIQMFYRRYMAQYMSSNLRTNVTSSSSLNKRGNNIVSMPKIVGSLESDAGVPRLVQHRTPKLVIQIMLAIMFLCGSLALLIGRYHDLVLWNPCTIAGCMVLFAGGQICQSRTSEDIDQMDTHDPARATTSPELTTHGTRNPLRPMRITLDSSEIAEDKGAASSFSDNSGLLGGASASGRAWRDQNARFRLGWWRDGVYMGSRRETSMWPDADQDGEKWRYGIDVQ